jgi:hypothetical protein
VSVHRVVLAFLCLVGCLVLAGTAAGVGTADTATNLSMTVTPADPAPGERVSFGVDEPGEYSYEWHFDADHQPEAAGTTANRSFEAGNHTVTVEALDADGNVVETATRTIRVEPPPDERPIFSLYGQHGASLPVNPVTGNPMLAEGISQRLRIETIGRQLGQRPNVTDTYLDGQIVNIAATTLTAVEPSQLFSDERLGLERQQGQRGFVTVTPTENGTGALTLRYGTFYDGITARDAAGEAVTLDVGTPRPLTVAVDPSTVSPGGQITVVVTDDVTGDRIAGVETVLSNSGTSYDDAVTDANGTATLTVPAAATLGDWSVRARSPGYDPTDHHLLVETRSIAVVDGQNATTLDSDQSLEDVDGDGDGDIFDALTYFNNRDSDAITENPEQFDFDGDGDSGDLFDALALYTELS